MSCQNRHNLIRKIFKKKKKKKKSVIAKGARSFERRRLSLCDCIQPKSHTGSPHVCETFVCLFFSFPSSGQLMTRNPEASHTLLLYNIIHFFIGQPVRQLLLFIDDISECLEIHKRTTCWTSRRQTVQVMTPFPFIAFI